METERIDIHDDPKARAILEGATAQSYKLPLGFPGFQGDLTVAIDTESWHGRVVAYTPRHVSVTLPNAEAQAWAEREIQSILGHRWPTPFAERDGRYTLTLGDTRHPLGVRIDLHGDPLRSHYRVCDDRITQVHRVMAEQHFTINILDVQHVCDGRHLPKHFTVVFREANSGQLVRMNAYTDRYAYVANCRLPALRRVLVTQAAGLRTYVMEVSNHRLLHEDGANAHMAEHTPPALRI